MNDLDELLTTADYAGERKCSERTIERERASGTGCKFVKIGRSVRYRRRDILDFIARHVRGSTSELAWSSPEDPIGTQALCEDLETKRARRTPESIDHAATKLAAPQGGHRNA
jgi:hypothetical protein